MLISDWSSDGCSSDLSVRQSIVGRGGRISKQERMQYFSARLARQPLGDTARHVQRHLPAAVIIRRFITNRAQLVQSRVQARRTRRQGDLQQQTITEIGRAHV